MNSNDSVKHSLGLLVTPSRAAAAAAARVSYEIFDEAEELQEPAAQSPFVLQRAMGTHSSS